MEQFTGAFVYFRTGQTFTVVDVDAGTVVTEQMPELAPGDAPYRLIRRGERLVFYGETDPGLGALGSGPEPAVYALDPTSPTTPTLIDEAWFFIPSAVEDRVWLAILDPTSPATVRALKYLREVSIDGRVITEDLSPPDGRRPAAAIEEGLIFQGEQSLEVWDPDSGTLVETLPGPFPIATWRNRLVARGEAGERTVYLIDLDRDTQDVVDLPEGVAAVSGYGGAFSADGRYVAIPGTDLPGTNRPETDAVIVLIDFESGMASVVPGLPDDMNGLTQVAWSSGDNWLFVSLADFSLETAKLFAFHPGDAAVQTIPVTLDGQNSAMAAG